MLVGLLTSLFHKAQIMRHPYFKHIPTSSYTHHQKSVVIDYGSKDIFVRWTHSIHFKLGMTHTQLCCRLSWAASTSPGADGTRAITASPTTTAWPSSGRARTTGTRRCPNRQAADDSPGRENTDGRCFLFPTNRSPASRIPTPIFWTVTTNHAWPGTTFTCPWVREQPLFHRPLQANHSSCN